MERAEWFEGVQVPDGECAKVQILFLTRIWHQHAVAIQAMEPQEQLAQIEYMFTLVKDQGLSDHNYRWIMNDKAGTLTDIRLRLLWKLQWQERDVITKIEEIALHMENNGTG